MTITDTFNLASTILLIGSAGAYFAFKRQRLGWALFSAVFLVAAVESAFIDGDVVLAVIDGAMALVFIVKAVTTPADR